MAKLRIFYKKSAIGYSQAQKDTIRSLGLRKLNSTAVHEDTPVVRGMVFKVKHLVTVEEVADDTSSERAAPQVRSLRATTPVATPPAVADDLEIVEGIGPKIAGVLAQEGITTFRKLADTEAVRLKEILVAHRLGQLADPATWPQQAELADAGRFDELKQLQSTLRAGRAN